MKYRILKEVLNNGIEKYYVERKRFLFWWILQDTSNYAGSRDMEFPTEYAAREAIQEEIGNQLKLSEYIYY